jgi:hypothetical protein
LVRPINGNGFSLLPTPTASDFRSGDSGNNQGTGNSSLRNIVSHGRAKKPRGYSGQAERGNLCPSHAGGPINPEWIEHLQGFPIGWTELEDSATP